MPFISKEYVCKLENLHISLRKSALFKNNNFNSSNIRNIFISPSPPSPPFRPLLFPLKCEFDLLGIVSHWFPISLGEHFKRCLRRSRKIIDFPLNQLIDFALITNWLFFSMQQYFKSVKYCIPNSILGDADGGMSPEF